jgi:hypothetical protein
MGRQRDSKGRFLKKTSGRGGGGRSKSRRSSSGSSTSTALVRAAPAQIIRVSAPRAMTKKKGHSGGRIVRVSGADRALDRGIIEALKHESTGLIGSAAYGYVTQSGTENAVKVKEYLDKVPTLDSIGKPLSHGLIALFVATKTRRGGWARKVSGAIAKGALYRGTFNFGASGFDLEKTASLGDDDDMSGEMEVEG